MKNEQKKKKRKIDDLRLPIHPRDLKRDFSLCFCTLGSANLSVIIFLSNPKHQIANFDFFQTKLNKNISPNLFGTTQLLN